MEPSTLAPPPFAEWLLRHAVAAPVRDGALGDFAELFADLAEREGLAAARRWYRRQALASLPAFLTDTIYWSLAMLRNYLHVAIRTLIRHKGYTAINVSGLAVGMACCILILLFVRHEWSYDRFHEHADRIYRVVRVSQGDDGTTAAARTAPATVPALRRDVPEVESAFRLQRFGGTVRYEDRLFSEREFFFADSTVFDVLTLPLLRGTPETALRAPYSVVLTASTARKYFGTADPLGQTLTLNDTLAFEVTGVMKDLPAASHVHPDFLASFTTWELIVGPAHIETWSNNTYYSYVLLSAGASAATVDAQMPAFVERHLGPQPGPGGTTFSLPLQPLTDIHLHSHLRMELEPNGDATYVYVLLSTALFILLIACINFMNLATARSAGRAREVGVRKAVGAFRGQVVTQFLGEAVVLALLALVLALGLVFLARPAFNALTGQPLTLGSVDLGVLPILVGLALAVGLLAGSYPAFYLSAFRPVAVLKGTPGAGRRGAASLLRQGLVVFQFALSIILMVGTGVVYTQVRYMQQQRLGFEAEQVVVLPFLWDDYVMDRYASLKEALTTRASVRYVTASGDVPGRMATRLSYQVDGMPDGVNRGIDALIVDPDFAEVYGLDVVAGRDFSDAFATDVHDAIVLNEAAVATLGWTPEEAIGKHFALSPYSPNGQVVGVVRDFHTYGLQETLRPLALAVWPSWFGYVSLRVDTNDLPQTLAAVESVWHAVIPDRPFDYFFLDADFNRQYLAEQRFGRVFTTFAGLALAIACLGLFGLASFTAEQRTKEIGVRKTLGATVPGLVGLLTGDFLKLVIVAFAVAAPVAYVAMNQWLNGFAYRIDISWTIFLSAGLAALGVAVLTVGYQSVKAALTDPVKALRYE